MTFALLDVVHMAFPSRLHVKRKGKKAFHIGGALQLLFGIYGHRWENPNYGVKEWGIPVGSYSNLINELLDTPRKQRTSCYC